MRALMIWAGICIVLILASLALRLVPENAAAALFTALLFTVTAVMFFNVTKGSK